MGARRAPIDRVVDLAVAVPTCTFVAMRRAIPLVARAGTVGAATFVGRLSEAVHQLRDEPDDAAAPVEAVPDASDPVAAEPSSIDVADLPIDGYDDLAARQVVDRLPSLDRADLARIEVYEREHRNRSTVLGKVAQLTA